MPHLNPPRHAAANAASPRAQVWLALRTATAAGLLAGCTIQHVKPYTPAYYAPVQTADAATASTNCFESTTSAERLACADPGLSAVNLALTRALQSDLRRADLFGRDALMASQRGFILGLPAACHLPDTADAPAPAGAPACLLPLYKSRLAELSAWSPRPLLAAKPGQEDAAAQYLRYKPASGSGHFNQALCATLASGINAAIARSGAAQAAALPGAEPIAGSHGAASGTYHGQTYAVALFDANAFAGFEQRARSVSVDGKIVLDSLSLGAAFQAGVANNGARFSAYASQTGDYGAAEVFAYQGQVLALISDAWGFTTPASPGEYAHAAVWDLAPTPPQPLCVFDIFQMPSDTGGFDDLPNFSRLRQLLSQIRSSTSTDLGVSALRDQAQLRNQASWMLLHMPLLVAQTAERGEWTNWLRLRHDAVLDAMFDWSAKSPANKQVFDEIFKILKPAAQELVTAYQQTEALDAKEAKSAAGVAVMELLYSATETIAPTLGADTELAGTPRYPILASPGG